MQNVNQTQVLPNATIKLTKGAANPHQPKPSKNSRHGCFNLLMQKGNGKTHAQFAALCKANGVGQATISRLIAWHGKGLITVTNAGQNVITPALVKRYAGYTAKARANAKGKGKASK